MRDPRETREVIAHFIAADSATFTKTLSYPPPVIYRAQLIGRGCVGIRFREYQLESYKDTKFGNQKIAIYREIIK